MSTISSLIFFFSFIFLRSLFFKEIKEIPFRILKEEFLEFHFLHFSEFMMENIYFNWIECFTQNERETLFYGFWLFSPPQLIFTSLGTLFNKKWGNESQEKVISFGLVQLVDSVVSKPEILLELFHFIERNEKLDNNLNSSFNTKLFWNKHLLSTLISIPDKVANQVKGKDIPPLLFPRPFFHHLVLIAWRYLKKSTSNLSLFIILELFIKLSQIGFGNTVIELSILETLNQWNQNCSPDSTQIFSQLLFYIPETSKESLIENLFRTLPNYSSQIQKIEEYLFYLLTPTLGNSLILDYLLSNKFFLVTMFEKPSLKLLVQFLNQSQTTNNSSSLEINLFYKACKNMFQIWGDINFVLHTSLKHHKYITESILECLNFLSKNQIEQWNLLNFLIRGAQVHMESPSTEIRHWGMQVAEKFSKIITPENPLNFDLKEEDEQQISPVSNLQSIKTNSEEPNQNLSHSKLDDPDAVVYLSDRDEQGSEDSLPAYDLEDDESDLKSCKTPIYLQECVIGLRGGIKGSEPNVDLIEASLNAVESIIRSEPDDLHDLSKLLVSILLHLHNEYNFQHFYFKRHNALVALLTLSTKKTVPYVTSEFYDTNYNISQRMEMLSILEDASTELATGKKPPSPTDLLNKNELKEEGIVSLTEKNSRTEELSKVIQISSNLSKKSYEKIVEERIEQNTRRWHIPPAKESLTRNSFLPVAGLFFYPLLQHFDAKPSSSSFSLSKYYSLLQGDKMIVSKLIHVLGIFIENLGTSGISSSEGLRMCHTLLDLLFVVRFHEEPMVRHASLFSLSPILLLLPESFLMKEFGQEFSEIQDWLVFTMTNDTDENCSAFATFLISSLQQKLKPKISEE